MTRISPNGQVEFKFYRPLASEVRLIGNFTGQFEPLEMELQGDGWWTAMASLDSGEYRFRYQADGEWYPDYAAYGIESGKTGLSSVLLIPGTRQQEKPKQNKILSKYVA